MVFPSPSTPENVTTTVNLVAIRATPKAHCSCEEFSEHRVCSHIPAALRLSKKELGYRYRFVTDAFVPVAQADDCFILDPWWNPAVEAQAIGRLHRIGQKKSVNVYRLISRGTIEDKVLELQNLKSQMISEMISDDSEGFIRSLNSKDLEFLLN